MRIEDKLKARLYKLWNNKTYSKQGYRF